MAITPRQQRFVEEYLVDLNATQASIRAGYSARTAEQQGPRLLGNVGVAQAIRAAQQARSARTEITQDMVVRELAKLGFADIRKAVTWRANVTGMVQEDDGSERLAVTNEVQLVDSDKLDDSTASAIAEISQTAQGGLRIKFHDKKAALDSLGRHLGMFKDKTELSGPEGAPLQVIIRKPGDGVD